MLKVIVQKIKVAPYQFKFIPDPLPLVVLVPEAGVPIWAWWFSSCKEIRVISLPECFVPSFEVLEFELTIVGSFLVISVKSRFPRVGYFVTNLLNTGKRKQEVKREKKRNNEKHENMKI